MVNEVLSQRFNDEQWNAISAEKPAQFLKKQQIILNKLLNEQNLFDRYFDTFYDNHVKLLNWSFLAIDNKASITPYIFKNLVGKGNEHYSEKNKKNVDSKYFKTLNQK